MRAYLCSMGYWLIVNGTTTAPTDPVKLQKWTLMDSMANGAIELRCNINIRDLIANTSVETWTNLSNAFGMTGVSRLFGDFKSVIQFQFSGTQHPVAEISCFNTHNARLVANGVTLNDYVLGMLLLGALPSKWDHVAAIYLQGKTAHTDIDYTEVRNAIIAEFDRTGTNPGQQQHAHKISAVKRRGKNDQSFSQQRSEANAPKARDDGRGFSNKKKPKKSNKGKGKAHMVEPAPTPFSLAASAVCPTIALQPSRAGPSTSTIATINPNRVTYSTVANPGAQKFTGAPKKAGPNTLQHERGLLNRLNVTPTIQNLKTMSLEQRLESPPPVPTMAPEAVSLANRIFESNRASSSTQESGPSISRFDAMVPPPVPHMPPKPKRKVAKKPKKVVIASAGLPPADMSTRRGSTPRIVEIPDDSNEVLDWGSSDEVMDFTSARSPGAIRVDNYYHSDDDRDGTGGVFDDHYDPRQVTFSCQNTIHANLYQQYNRHCQDPKKPLSHISLSDRIRSNRKHFIITILTYLSFVPRPTSNIIILIRSTSS